MKKAPLLAENNNNKKKTILISLYCCRSIMEDGPLRKDSALQKTNINVKLKGKKNTIFAFSHMLSD